MTLILLFTTNVFAVVDTNLISWYSFDSNNGNDLKNSYNLAGLQGGSAEEYYHLTQAQFIIATQAASSTQSGYLTSVNWATFNGKANMTDLNAYTLLADTNRWASQLDVQMQIDSNKWSLTKLDANGFYPLKADVNMWAGQLDAPLLSKADANGFYPLKADVNTWGDQRYLKLTGGNITGSVVATQDVNAKVLNADNNIYIGTNVYMYDDGTALIIGRT